MLTNSDSDEEMNLDLPAGNLKKKMTMRIMESSELSGDEEKDSSEQSNDNSEDNTGSSLIDSELEQSSPSNSQSCSQGSQSRKQKKKKKKGSKKVVYLSNEFIINSDIDGMDEPDHHSEVSSDSESGSGSGSGSGSEMDGDSSGTSSVNRRRSLTSESKSSKKTKKNDFVKATGEDFKTTLRFIGNYSESESESEPSSESEADDEGGMVIKSVKRQKKPKETLKSVLKESEQLLRRQESVSLPVDVINPRSLCLVLNEALAMNSKAPKDAIKLVIEEKRKAQRMKLEKILGKDRMIDLIKDNPKIGQDKLDETVEIHEAIHDEKAGIDEDVLVKKIKFKLTDLPDKHFDPSQRKRGSSGGSEVVAGYRAHLQIQKKSSIDVLNEKLKDKIAAQGDALIAHDKRAQALHHAAMRVKAEARVHARRINEVRKERELKAKREARSEGSGLFEHSKTKYEGIERPVVSGEANLYLSDDDDKIGVKPQTKKTKAKVVVSSDIEEYEANANSSSEPSCESDVDLLNLDNNSEHELPDMNDAISGLLSGKFEKIKSGSETEEAEEAEGPVNYSKFVKPAIKSAFIDDEASDEDEERGYEDFGDEEAMELEMKKSKFIDEESGDDGVDRYDTIQFINETARKNDEEITNKLMAKLSKHVIEEEDKLLDNLSKRYGIIPTDDKASDNTVLISQDIQRLLDPIEQKKRKLAALGSWNILQRPKTITAANEEFRFKDEKKIGDDNGGDSDYYASETDHETTCDDEDEDEDDDKYYETVESGLQSRVEEMLDAELLDCEEVQVQASESLVAHLSALNNKEEEAAVDEGRGIVSENINISTSQSQSSGKRGGVTVPLVNAKLLKSRLMALHQENDDESNNEKKGGFKGFTFKNK